MNCALLCRELYRQGGLEKWARLLSAGFMERGVEVTIVTHDSSHTPFQCHTLPKRGLFSFQRLRNYDSDCQDFLKRRPFDIIFGLDRHSHQTHYRAGNGVHAVHLARRQEGWLKGLNPLHWVVLDLERRTFESRELKRLFTNSEMVKEEILTHYRANPAIIEVVHNGVEWDDFNAPFQKRSDPKGRNLLFVGHGYARKGLMQLFKALQHLKSAKWSLSVVGKERHESAYMKAAKSYGIDKQVTFFGAQSNLIPFFQQADILIIPSLYDPFANVTLEGLAMGLFVLSSQYNGGKEVLNEKSGALIPDLFDPLSFAEAIDRALLSKRDPQEIRESVRSCTTAAQLNKMIDRTLLDAS